MFEPFHKKFMETISLDPLIMMDTTGSKGSWFKMCKENINDLFNTIKYQFPNIKTRIAFIWYKETQDRTNLDEKRVSRFL